MKEDNLFTFLMFIIGVVGSVIFYTASAQDLGRYEITQKTKDELSIWYELGLADDEFIIGELRTKYKQRANGVSVMTLEELVEEGYLIDTVVERQKKIEADKYNKTRSKIEFVEGWINDSYVVYISDCADCEWRKVGEEKYLKYAKEVEKYFRRNN